MSENQPSPAPQRKVAYISFAPDKFGELVDSITNLPYRSAAPLMQFLQEHGRATFEDQLARIVPDVPEDPPANPPIDPPNEGGA